MKNEKEIKYFSMFTGVGGFELGLSRVGSSRQQSRGSKESLLSNMEKSSSKEEQYQCVGFSEVDKYANQLLATKFPDIRNYGDARKIIPSELPDFDMLCGGFPCQSFSIAGKRKGIADDRGTLFNEIMRIAEVKKPKLLFLENVKGLLSAPLVDGQSKAVEWTKGYCFAHILQRMADLGYDVQWFVLNSKFFGVPQNRERVFIIGSLRGTPRPEILPFRESNGKINKIIGEKAMITSASPMEFGWKEECGALRSRDYKEPKIVITKVAEINKGASGIVMDINGVSQTIQTNGGGQGAKTGLYDVNSITFRNKNRSKHQNKEGMKIRRLTPIECERLQGFPDNWTEGFSDTQRYKMMGNAVTVNVIKAIGERLSQTKLEVNNGASNK